MSLWYLRYCPSTSYCYLEVVGDQFAQNLLSIFQEIAQPGSTIHSTSWAECNNILPLLSFQHVQVDPNDPSFCFL